MTSQAGGCICGRLRFAVSTPPERVTICHCRFCQRATGSAYMVEAIFGRDAVAMTAGTPATFVHTSEGSGKSISIHFCAACGTKLYLTFERYDQICGVYSGTFDDPDFVQVKPENSKHIFLNAARPETLVPASVNCYFEHAILNDGTPVAPVAFDAPVAVYDLRAGAVRNS